MLVIISSTICEQHATILSKDFISKNLNVLSTYVSIENLCVSLEPSGGSRVSRRGGVWTPEAATFRKICMSKRKNRVPYGGRAPDAPPWIRQWNLQKKHKPEKCLSSGGSRISRRARHGSHRGAWTPEAVVFRKFCMSKWKNLDP